MATLLRIPSKTAGLYPPSVAGINWSSPFAEGLLFATVNAEYDLVSGKLGTFTNAPAVRFLPDINLSARDFTGNGGAKKIVFSSVASQISTAVTVAAWVVADASVNFAMAVSHATQGGAGSEGFELRQHSGSGWPSLAVDASTRLSANSPTSIVGTGPHLIAGTYDGSDIRVYDNGVEKNNSGLTGSINFGSSPELTIGTRRNAGQYYWDGVLGAISIWNRALSAAEIRDLYSPQYRLDLYAQQYRTYFIPAAAGGGATVSPTTGSLTLTGATPSIALLINRSLTAGALTLTGEQPSVSRQFQKTPASASLTLTGAAPVVAFNITRTPAAAALTITGQQPGVLVETPGVTEVQPNTGVLTLTGESPAIAIKIDRSPTAASLTLTGEQPSVAVESFKDVQPTAASLTLTGASPSIALKVNVSPSVSTLSITGAEIGVSVPGLGRTTSAGSSKGRRRTQRGYPRRVVIDGVVYTVRSAEELRRLLAAQHERLQEELQALSPEAPATKARSLKRQITVVQKKIDATERDYMQAILDDDDEVITVWAMLQ